MRGGEKRWELSKGATDSMDEHDGKHGLSIGHQRLALSGGEDEGKEVQNSCGHAHSESDA